MDNSAYEDFVEASEDEALEEEGRTSEAVLKDEDGFPADYFVDTDDLEW